VYLNHYKKHLDFCTANKLFTIAQQQKLEKQKLGKIQKNLTITSMKTKVQQKQEQYV